MCGCDVGVGVVVVVVVAVVVVAAMAMAWGGDGGYRSGGFRSCFVVVVVSVLLLLVGGGVGDGFSEGVKGCCYCCHCCCCCSCRRPSSFVVVLLLSLSATYDKSLSFTTSRFDFSSPAASSAIHVSSVRILTRDRPTVIGPARLIAQIVYRSSQPDDLDRSSGHIDF